MLDCNSDTGRETAFRRASQLNSTTRRLASDKLLVTPHKPGHAPAVVIFDNEGRTCFAFCRYRSTPNLCPGNEKGSWCHHVAAAVTSLTGKGIVDGQKVKLTTTLGKGLKRR